MVLPECLCGAEQLQVLRGRLKRSLNTLTERHWTKFFMDPFPLQSGDGDALDEGSKAFTRSSQVLKYHLWISMQVVVITYQRVLIVSRQGRPLLDQDALHPTGPDLHFIDHVADHFYC